MQQLGMGNVMGDGRQYFPWVHLDDIVGLYEVRTSVPSSSSRAKRGKLDASLWLCRSPTTTLSTQW
jgi:hypothetical protein